MTSSLKQWLGALGLTAAGVVAIASNSPSEVIPVTPAIVPAVTQNAAPEVETPQPVAQPKPADVKPVIQEKAIAPVAEPTPKPAVNAPTLAPAPAPAPKPKPAPVQTAPNGTYTNTAGNEVPSPYHAPSAPAGASAQCRDGTYSFSQSRRGTCSGHGGVAEWL